MNSATPTNNFPEPIENTQAAPPLKTTKNPHRRLVKAGTCAVLNIASDNKKSKRKSEAPTTTKNRLGLPLDTISNIRRLRRVSEGNLSSDRGKRRKKVNTKKKWDCLRGLVKGAHRIFKVANELQLYGYPNYDSHDNDRNLRRLSKNLLVQVEKTDLNIKKDQKKALPWYLISPESKFKTIWSILLILPLLYTAFLVPFNVAFMEYYSSLGWMIAENIVSFMFMTDVFINLFSVHRNAEGKLIRSHKEIVYQYLKGWFIPDLIACCPFQLMVTCSTPEYESYESVTSLLRFPRIYSILKMTKLIKTFIGEDKDTISGVFKSAIEMNSGTFICSMITLIVLVRLLTFISMMMAFTHFFACLWFFVTKLEDPTQSWLYHNKLQNDSAGRQYLFTLYWALATLSTVGYGDIAAHSDSTYVPQHTKIS
eukprot:TRINITY_DN135088_c0_g1_i1.p1 TRINITY_DN135088_c0_g1~~TRINITY_DN135088_c0_g1_i1.p1  ORF type:complete len:455 (-),score=25.39 TRINITY_DN135088_c0_g1_i1:2196-3467(-)